LNSLQIGIRFLGVMFRSAANWSRSPRADAIRDMRPGCVATMITLVTAIKAKWGGVNQTVVRNQRILGKGSRSYDADSLRGPAEYAPKQKKAFALCC
jgi:hypothetical protein